MESRRRKGNNEHDREVVEERDRADGGIKSAGQKQDRETRA